MGKVLSEDKKRACDACRARKVKCTKIVPCENCVKRDRPCTFEYALGKQQSGFSTSSEPKRSLSFTTKNSLISKPDSEAILPPPFKGDLVNSNENVTNSEINSPEAFLLIPAVKDTNGQNTSDATRSPAPLTADDFSNLTSGSGILSAVPAVQPKKEVKGPEELSSPVFTKKEIPAYELNVMNTLVTLEPRIDSLLKSVVKTHSSPMTAATTAALLRFFRDINPVFPLFDLDYFLLNLSSPTKKFNAILKSIVLLMHAFEKDPAKTRQTMHHACQTYIAIFGLIPPTLPFFVATFVLHNTLTTLFSLNN